MPDTFTTAGSWTTTEPEPEEELEPIECDECGSVIESEASVCSNALLGSVCTSCDESTHECPICNDTHREEDEANECCQYRCENCEELYEYESDAENCCQYQCDHCSEWHDDPDARDSCCRRGGDPFYPSLPILSPYQLTVPELPNRPARLVSIEQELTGGGAAVARMLSDEDLSSFDYIESYNYQPGIADIVVCEDGSLPDDGGEVKYSRFNLNRATDSGKLSLAIGKIRQLHKDAGIVDVGQRAGMHIHHSARDLYRHVIGPMQMTALHELFCFGESMIYGLAAAGWPRHRYEAHGNDYAKPIPKIEGKTPWKVARVMGSKYYGVNFERLLNTVNRCSCGSVRFGAWSECECGAFDKATVEWRVFNTSTMPETIHAWILFSSAVMALAHTHEVGTLPDNPFNPNVNDDYAKRDRWRVMEWFLSRAPLERDEQDVIRAAADRSPLMQKEV